MENRKPDTTGTDKHGEELSKPRAERPQPQAQVDTDVLRRIEATQTDPNPSFQDDDPPMIPDGAFITAPSPDTPSVPS